MSKELRLARADLVSHFFGFLGILCVALPHADVVAMFLSQIMQFKDEPFYDAAAGFWPRTTDLLFHGQWLAERLVYHFEHECSFA